MLSAIIKLNKEKIRTNFISLKHSEDNSSDYILNICAEANLEYSIKKDDKLKIYIKVKNKKGKYIILNLFAIVVYSVDYEGEEIKIVGSVNFSNDYYSFNQGLVDHINNYWNDPKQQINKDLFKKSDYGYYLDTLLLWNGVPEKIELKPKYILDGKNIYNQDDLYIHIGELFMGNRGYFGNNLDALEDCFRSVKESLQNENFILELRNNERLVSKLGSDYLKNLIEVFNEFGNVIIS